MSDKRYQKVRERFLTGSAMGHAELGPPSSSLGRIEGVKTMPKRNGDKGDTEVVLDAPARVPEPDRSHVRLVAGDPPMLRLEINLYSWERGDSDIEVVLPHSGELSDLLHWALPEQRLVICGNLRARIYEELAEVFDILQDTTG
jgi:hypothetical protein